MRRVLPIFCAVYSWAQSGIEVPSIGAIVDPSGALRPVQGVAGSFLLGPATVSGVLSAACSEGLCLAKTDSKILSPSGETEAPPGPAIFGLRNGDAVVFFPEVRSFARWHDDTLSPLDWTLEGEVLSIRLIGREAEIAVRREGSIFIVRPESSVVDWISDLGGPVLFLADGVLLASADELIIRRRDRSEKRFELTKATGIVAMGARYAAIRAGDLTYALRTESGRESLFLLPGISP